MSFPITLKLIDQEIPYTGRELSVHWIYKTFGIQGNACVAFCGPCDVKKDQLVDLEDVIGDKFIFSQKMLHFLVEIFDPNLEKAVLRQRLFMSLIKDELDLRVHYPTFIRVGDDIYEGEAKVTVSIATASPVSTLMHVGVNIDSRNTPLLTMGLTDYKIDPFDFARSILEKFERELSGIQRATTKVTPAHLSS